MSTAIYFFPGACSRVTMTALEQIGIPYDAHFVDLLNGEQKSGQYLRINPKGKVPTLSVDDRLLTENPAILSYLAKQYPQSGLLPQPKDEFAAAQIQADLNWCSSTLHTMVRQMFNPQRFTIGETEGVRQDGISKMAEEADSLNERLSSGPWWYGNQWSVVDAYITWGLSVAMKSEWDISKFPVLADHMARTEAHPAWQAAVAREETNSG